MTNKSLHLIICIYTFVLLSIYYICDYCITIINIIGTYITINNIIGRSHQLKIYIYNILCIYCKTN